MFTGLSLLEWIAGLTILYGCFKVAVWIAEAPLIGEDHPQARSALDSLERDGLARFADGRSDHA